MVKTTTPKARGDTPPATLPRHGGGDAPASPPSAENGERDARPTSLPPIPAELDELISAAEALQARLGVNNSEFVRRYGWAVSSLDVWVRTLCARDPRRLTPSNYTKWTDRLRRLLAEAEQACDGGEVYPLPIVGEAERLWRALDGATGDIRVAWLTGTTGSGKTVALRHLLARHRGAASYVLVSCTWRGRGNAFVRGLAAAAGADVSQARSEAAALDALVRWVAARPQGWTFLLDEFHAAEVAGVKIVKELVDRCPFVRFLLTTWPRGFDALRKDGVHIATAQLTGRSLQPFCHDWQTGPREADIAQYLRCATPGETAAEVESMARFLRPGAQKWGFRFVAKTLGAARALRDGGAADSYFSAMKLAAAELSRDVVSYSAANGGAR